MCECVLFFVSLFSWSSGLEPRAAHKLSKHTNDLNLNLYSIFNLVHKKQKMGYRLSSRLVLNLGLQAFTLNSASRPCLGSSVFLPLFLLRLCVGLGGSFVYSWSMYNQAILLHFPSSCSPWFWRKKTPKFKDFKFCGVFIDLFLSVFNDLHLCVGMCVRRGRVPVESRRGPWILGLWASWHGCWELNLSPPQEQ